MKRIFALALAVAMLTALLCACGDKNGATTGGNVTTTVATKYDDGYASNYASSTSTDDNGNKVYEFSGEQYEKYKENHKNTVANDIQGIYVANHDKSFGEYVYINEDSKSVIVGLHEGEYDKATAAEEAKSAAEYGFKYFQNLQQPVNAIKVVYCNAGDQSKIYGSFDFTAE